MVIIGKYGSCDFKELKAFQDKLGKLQENEIDIFIQSCAKELAARLLAKTVKRTPVGQYKHHTGGELRKGWKIGEIKNTESGYEVEIINPVEYSSYVEYGHRTNNHKGWVNGKFMLTISEQELKDSAPGILEGKLKKMLGESLK